MSLTTNIEENNQNVNNFNSQCANNEELLTSNINPDEYAELDKQFRIDEATAAAELKKSVDSKIEALALLTDYDYTSIRRQTAKFLGIALSDLDKMVRIRKKEFAKKNPSTSAEDSIEIQYADAYNNENWCKQSSRQGDPIILNWVGNHWNVVNNDQGATIALGWLEKTNRKYAHASQANSCHATFKLKIDQLQEADKRSIIPFNNTWLYINENNDLKTMSANREYDIRYIIDVDLNHANGNYAPKELPANSKFKNYLDHALPDQQLQSVLQEYSGYTLLNDVRYQKALALVGEGGTGKSVYLELIQSIHQNVGSIPLNKLNGFGAEPLLYCSLITTPEGTVQMDEEDWRSAVSGDLMQIECKYGGVFSHRPIAKWVMSFNTFPHIRDKTNAVFRRMIIIPFDNVVSDEDKNANLAKEIIAEELDIFVDWCIAGLLRLLKRDGFEKIEKIEDIKHKFRDEGDSVRLFIRELDLTTTEHPQTPKDNIMQDYLDFCKLNNMTPCSGIETWRRLNIYLGKNKIFTRREMTQGKYRYFCNIGVRPHVKDVNKYNNEISHIEFDNQSTAA